MPDNKREYDAVLGTQQLQPPIHGAVLGGIENVKKCLVSDNSSVKITALSNALKYGAAGLEIVVQALQDKYSLFATSCLLAALCSTRTFSSTSITRIQNQKQQV